VVRSYILEEIRNLDGVLADIMRAGGTIPGLKFSFVCKGLRIVAFVCDCEVRHPDIDKARKIIDWPARRSLTEATGFIGICVYYAIWKAKFSLIAEPIFRLVRCVSKTPAKEKGKRKSEPVEFR
jgi:hypothetical protein